MARVFSGASTVLDDRLALGLAPALTPQGLQTSPSFFHGFAAHPQVIARALVVLSEITATRYFQFVTTDLRDPVLSAHGDRLRAEVFSACNSVYASLEVFGTGLDGGDIGFGTTNVDINAQTRTMLNNISQNELMHLNVGTSGLTVSTVEVSALERPVQMPARWVRALGNASDMHQDLRPVFQVQAPAARAFLASLPPASAQKRAGWLIPEKNTIRVAPAKPPKATGVWVAGLQRLSALKRLLPHVMGLSAFGTADPLDAGGTGAVAIALDLPHARVTLGLTDVEWRGFSGEGALLESLATPDVVDNADLLSALLAFDAHIDTGRLARESGLTNPQVTQALAVLASSGRVGWEINEGQYFHRELPQDNTLVTKDNPRLVSARKLVEDGQVRRVEGATNEWIVASGSKSAGSKEYTVRVGTNSTNSANNANNETPLEQAQCTCTWYLKHGTGRGPCKHVLAVVLTLGESRWRD
ncbi:MAG: SWIM zinc finger family protein [Actinomycetaceae bacterium]|nr:SWIM zinc finger family protein [Actinomycetaceae bacterium]